MASLDFVASSERIVVRHETSLRAKIDGHPAVWLILGDTLRIPPGIGVLHEVLEQLRVM